MTTEILDYRYTSKWELESILQDKSFTCNIQEKFPLVIATMSHYNINAAEICQTAYLQGKRRSSPLLILDSYPGGFARRIGEYLNSTGEMFIINANCSSAIYALHIGTMASQNLNSPVIVVCADNVNHPFDLWKFNALMALDNDTGNPFDKLSKGFRMGTGISVFLIKHSSVKYTMPPIAAIIKYAFYTSNSLTNPGTSDDIIKNIDGINYKSIDFWNAHATGTPIGDIIEYEFFNKTVKKDIPIVSFKGHVGHCMCASGGVEISMALDGKKINKLLPNIIKGEKIVNDDRIITDAIPFTFKKMLKASLGFGGRTAVAEIDLY